MPDIENASAQDLHYVDQGYALPEGYTWARVRESRQRWSLAAHVVPVAVGHDVCAWAVPIANGAFLNRLPVVVSA